MIDKKRPEVCHGHSIKLLTPCGNFIINLNNDDKGNFYELIINTDEMKDDKCKCAKFLLPKLAIAYSTYLQLDLPVEELTEGFHESLKKHAFKQRCTKFTIDGIDYYSCLDLIYQKIKAILNTSQV
jgi:hypothetical protein